MKKNWKGAIACFMVLALIATLCFGCDEEGEKGKVTITIGELTDFTGPASPAVIAMHYALEDIAEYYNEENLIPGVEIKIASWDTKIDPSRVVPGYEWLRGQGAKVIITLFPGDDEILKPFAERDKVFIAATGATGEAFDPPGWVFGFANVNPWAMTPLLQWISENDWDYEAEGRPPKLGYVKWSGVGAIPLKEAMEEYVQEHPDKFKWVGSSLPPSGTMTFGGSAEQMKDCDYITSCGMEASYFMEEFRSRGYTATIIDPAYLGGYIGFMVDKLGWEAIDGILTAEMSLWWNETTPIVNVMNELADKYRPGEDKTRMGFTYVGAGQQLISVFDVLQDAIEDVGAENFDGQAFYDAAIEYKTTRPMWWEGYPEWGFSETKRYLMDHIVIYEFDAEAETLVKLTDWLPLVK